MHSLIAEWMRGDSLPLVPRICLRNGSLGASSQIVAVDREDLCGLGALLSDTGDIILVGRTEHFHNAILLTD